ncbi:MAG: TlpA disulfide reductase family protein [Acidimicrobiia bacterium]|nr:TlpA disulfide reductase family protein [Acidimicrobiia bacterium]
MDQNEDRDRQRGGLFLWLSLFGVFVAAVAVTLIVTSGADPAESEFPDLGDLVASDPNVPNTDELAPTFALPTLNGEVFDLAAHVADEGKPVVLNLWASWCPPCRAEMPAINTASQRHPDVEFVGVAVNDDPDKAADFAAEIAVAYTIAIDDGTVEEAYPVLGLPGTFFINPDGTIAKRHFGVVTVDSLDDDIAELFGS